MWLRISTPLSRWAGTHVLALSDIPWKTKRHRTVRTTVRLRRHASFSSSNSQHVRLRRTPRTAQCRRDAINSTRTSYVPPSRWAEIHYETKQYASTITYDKREKIQLARRAWAYRRLHARSPTVLGMHAHAMASSSTKKHKPKFLVFDSGSYPILVDNCASSSITNCIHDFIRPPKSTTKMIQGVNGELTALKIGTICWKIQDDQGRTHVLTLPNSYYAPSSPYRLLSPQHWAQTAKDYSPSPRGTWSATDEKEIILHWNQNRFTKTVKLHRATNVGMFQSAPSNAAFAQLCLDSDTLHPLAFSSTIDLSDPNETSEHLGGKPQIQAK